MAGILVTGVGGNVGQYVAQKLHHDGYHVIGVFRNNRPRNNEYKLIHADLTENKLDFKDIDTIIHAAAGISGSTEKLVRDNIISTMNLLKTAERKSIRRFIYMSTVSVYGSVDGELNENSDIINPEIYGETKYLAESLVKESNISEKIVLELPRMLGPFVDLNNTKGSGFLTMIKKILNNEDITCFIPNVLYNNYMHVSDLVQFIELLLDSEKWDSYNKVLLGAKDTLPMMEILNIMKNAIHSNSKIIADDKGTSAKCALVAISRAVQMGYAPMDSQNVLYRFMNELGDLRDESL